MNSNRFAGSMMFALVLISLLGTAAKPEEHSADMLKEVEHRALSKTLHDAARQTVREAIVQIRASLAETVKPDIERAADGASQRIAVARGRR